MADFVGAIDQGTTSTRFMAGFWKDVQELRQNCREDKRWRPASTPEQREIGYRGWKRAVERSFDLVDPA